MKTSEVYICYAFHEVIGDGEISCNPITGARFTSPEHAAEVLKLWRADSEPLPPLFLCQHTVQPIIAADAASREVACGLAPPGAVGPSPTF
jgi:hypothetical protein